MRKTAASTVTFYYQYAGTRDPAVEDTANALIGGKAAASQPNTGMLTKSFSLSVGCFDYWMCTGDPYWNVECVQHYETNKAHWCVSGGCGYSFVG